VAIEAVKQGGESCRAATTLRAELLVTSPHGVDREQVLTTRAFEGGLQVLVAQFAREVDDCAHRVRATQSIAMSDVDLGERGSMYGDEL
jgi:hypothetical protein